MKDIITNALSDNVEVAMFDVDRIRDAIPGWDDLSRQEKLQKLDSFEPDGQFTAHNVITKSYREHLAKLINSEIAEAAVDVTHMAFGDDNTATSTADTHLINEVYRDAIDDHIDRSGQDEYAATMLIQSDEAVGLSLLEGALVTESDSGNADDMAINRVLLDDPENRLDPKDSDHAVTVTMEIIYQDESQVA